MRRKNICICHQNSEAKKGEQCDEKYTHTPMNYLHGNSYDTKDVPTKYATADGTLSAPKTFQLIKRGNCKKKKIPKKNSELDVASAQQQKLCTPSK